MKIFILAFSVCSCLTVRGIKSCLSPSVPNAEPTNDLKLFYISGETVRFECNSGYGFEGTRYAVCDNGKWRLPVCKNASCTAPHVANAKPEKKLESSYASGHTVRFVCDRNYEFEETSYAVCDDGTWWLPVCKEKITCSKPRVHHTEPEELKNSYDIGETIRFRCRPSYEFDGSDSAECVDGSWRLPVCRPRRVSRCNQPRVQNGHHAGRLASSYATGSWVKFVCEDGYEFEGTHYAQCDNGQWKLPVCKQAVTGGHPVSDNKEPSSSGLDCGTRPLIENGDFTELQGGNKLLVQCKVLYKRVGPEQVTCDSGVWTQLPVCKPPCKLDRSRFYSQYNADEYLQEGETKNFYCVRGRYYYSITIHCTNGEAVYSDCH